MREKPSDEIACNSPLTEKDKETLVLGVTVSGAPFSGDAEQRRRTRYAVLAGLERAGFVPRDARRIGYFWWWTNPPPSAALQLPPLALSRLLLLRALRPEFPKALFFTTDFDEAFAIKTELPFTRNLIISSSFGPNLSDKLQGAIPFATPTKPRHSSRRRRQSVILRKFSETTLPNSSGSPHI